MQTLTVKLNGADKVVEFKDAYTRKIDREFNNIIFEDVKANASTTTQGVEVNLQKIQTANDYLVLNMTNLTQDEIDQLSINDYNKILEKINDIKIPS